MWVSRWLTSEKSGLLVQILQVKGMVDGPFMMFIFGATAAVEYVEKRTLVLEFLLVVVGCRLCWLKEVLSTVVNGN